jgi:hypothetical protein
VTPGRLINSERNADLPGGTYTPQHLKTIFPARLSVKSHPAQRLWISRSISRGTPRHVQPQNLAIPRGGFLWPLRYLHRCSLRWWDGGWKFAAKGTALEYQWRGAMLGREASCLCIHWPSFGKIALYRRWSELAAEQCNLMRMVLLEA